MTPVLSTALNGLNAATTKVGEAANNIAKMGTDQADDVDTIQDIVDIKVAEHAFKANLAVMRTDNEMTKELFRVLDETA